MSGERKSDTTISAAQEEKKPKDSRATSLKCQMNKIYQDFCIHPNLYKCYNMYIFLLFSGIKDGFF